MGGARSALVGKSAPVLLTHHLGRSGGKLKSLFGVRTRAKRAGGLGPKAQGAPRSGLTSSRALSRLVLESLMPRFCSRELRNAIPPQISAEAELQAQLHEVLQEVEQSSQALARSFHRAAFLVEAILQVAARGFQGPPEFQRAGAPPPPLNRGGFSAPRVPSKTWRRKCAPRRTSSRSSRSTWWRRPPTLLPWRRGAL